jgi:3-deoxy-D-manno-octulosonate 8-phosphate phosphatase (KDO 8-P phosphatase)
MADTRLDAGREQSIGDRCQAIDALVLDVDGVLTDGRIVYADDGREIKSFHVRDGAGLKLWRQAGKSAAILTGRSSRAVEIRARELGIEPVVQGAADKLAAFDRLLAGWQTAPDRVAYVGDDVPDLPLLARAGLAVAVADACAEARATAHYVTRVPGGQGAVREVVELILRSQGQWQTLVERCRGQAVG